jgi:polyisoprenoid-binding protein YceI
MKNIFSSLVVLMAIVVFTSCGTNTKTTTEAERTNSAPEVTYKVDAANSAVSWLGEVAGVYGHDGVINIAEGTVSANGNVITGGKVVIDMATIQPANPESYKDEDGSRASDLVSHLSTGDFFMVETYPTATFVIKSHQGNTVTGDLTVRGITKEETATITSMVATPAGLTAKADLVFNRQDYKVSWVHFMKDMILSDDIKLGINISATSL